MLTIHAREQLAARIPDPTAREAFAAIAEREAMRAATLPGCTAIRLGRCPRTYTADGSNGDYIVAIAERGTVVTVYYRRASQPCPPRAARMIDATR
jgi:hypothetical protein